MPFEGVKLGNYQLIRLIGSGGMGEVYLIDSSPTVVNGVVYVGSFDGKLYAFHLPWTS